MICLGSKVVVASKFNFKVTPNDLQISIRGTLTKSQKTLVKHDRFPTKFVQTENQPRRRGKIQ